jgi:hypothetical protein
MKRKHLNRLENRTVRYFSVLFLLAALFQSFTTCEDQDTNKTILVTEITINGGDVSVYPDAEPNVLTVNVLPGKE